MDPQNPNSTDPNNPSVPTPDPGVTPPSVTPAPVQPDLSSILGSTPPPVEPMPTPPTEPNPLPTVDLNLNPPPPVTVDSSQIPTYTPPSWMNPAPTTANPEPTAPSPLDNPTVSTDQNAAPPVEPIPTYMPPSTPTLEMAPATPEPIPVGPNPITEPNIPQSTAPVDLSQLISNAQQSVQTENPTGIPPSSAPSATETIVNVAPTTTTETAAAESRGFPKWLIGVAVGLLILVVGASAYFILGIGQNNQQTSLPATQTTGRLATPAPIPSPRSVTPPQPTTLPATSSATQQATSAADLIRLKQQGK